MSCSQTLKPNDFPHEYQLIIFYHRNDHIAAVLYRSPIIRVGTGHAEPLNGKC